MQIILLEKIADLGVLGDVVKVRDGYARNFLIPQGKAKRATKANLEEFDKQRAELERRQNETLVAAQAQAQQLDGLTVQITRKTGVDGKLFGSVTSHDVLDALAAAGHRVERSMVRMPAGPLKAVGDFPLAIALHADVHATITVSVLGEQ
jgi:large subunit ribosomal protein L9